MDLHKSKIDPFQIEIRSLLNRINRQLKHHAIQTIPLTHPEIRDAMTKDPHYSKEQKAASLSTDSNTIMMAGAGSGKTHTMLNRLTFLQSQGVKLNHILVLSFTNTATKNVETRYPGVQAMTMSSFMLHLFTEQFYNRYGDGYNDAPRISVTDANRLANELRTADYQDAFQFKLLRKWNRNDPTYSQRLAFTLAQRLVDLRKPNIPSDPFRYHHSIVNLYEFTRQNLAFLFDLIHCLNKAPLILMESMMNALLRNNLQYHRDEDYVYLPFNYDLIKYICVDEVQDTSIMDYTLLLKFATKQKTSVTLVGDNNQTLYEFRDANPKIFEMIANSPAFTAYQLNNNYRSNNDILMFANQVLSKLPTSKVTTMQLTNMAKTKPTKQSFYHHIKYLNIEMNELEAVNMGMLIPLLQKKLYGNQKLIKWVISKYQKHEQIACMAYTNDEVSALGKWISTIIQQYTNQEPNILKLSHSHTEGITLVSSFIVEHLAEIKTWPTNDYFTHMLDLLDHIPIPYGMKVQTDLLLNELSDTLRTYFPNHRFRHQTNADYTKYFIKLVLAWEDNVDREAYLAKQHRQKDVEENGLPNAEIILATIHSAKGLEFDNTIILCNEFSKSNNGIEADLRAFGVALTRAKKNEYLINCADKDQQSTLMATSPLRSSWENITAMLN